MFPLLHIHHADVEVVARVYGQSLPERLTGIWRVPLVTDGELSLRGCQLALGKDGCRIVTLQGNHLAIDFFDAIRSGQEFHAEMDGAWFSFRASDVSLVLRFFGEFVGNKRCVEGALAQLTRDGSRVAEFEVFESQAASTDRNLKWEVNDATIAHSVLNQLNESKSMSIELRESPRS